MEVRNHTARGCAKPEADSKRRRMMRALEEVTQRMEGIDDQRPYPGLASFSSLDAEYFYGREPEVETIIKKMQQCPMIAMIGPSGAGKTSFLRAGLLPALPKDWCSIFTTPGDAPILNLAESLSRSIGNPGQFEDPDNAVHKFLLLRQSYKEIVLIVDRFEELFTLNHPRFKTATQKSLGAWRSKQMFEWFWRCVMIF